MSAPIGNRTIPHWRQSLILGIRSMINIDLYIYYWLYRIFNMLRIYRTIIFPHLIPYINSKINILTHVNICEPFNTSESYRKYNYNLFHPTWPGGKTMVWTTSSIEFKLFLLDYIISLISYHIMLYTNDILKYMPMYSACWWYSLTPLLTQTVNEV